MSDPTPTQSSPTLPTKSCPACDAQLRAEHAFCTSCGAELEHAEELAEQQRLRAQRRERQAAEARKKKMGRAGIWLLVLAGLFAVSGTVEAVNASEQAAEAHRNLAEYEDHEELDVDGETITAGALRKQIDGEVTLAYAVTFGLTGVMVALYFWSRRSPLPALVSALCLFLVLNVVSGVFDPKTLLQGVVIKILVVAALLGGIRSALSDRTAKARARPAVPAG